MVHLFVINVEKEADAGEEEDKPRVIQGRVESVSDLTLWTSLMTNAAQGFIHVFDRGRWICKESSLQGKGLEIARNGILKERPHDLHPCEFARNGFIQEIKKCNFARKGMQGMDFARNRATKPAIWDHTVLPAPQRKWTRPTLTSARKWVLDSPTPEGWKAAAWVDLGYPVMERPGVELATSRTQVRRPNHYTTEPPTE